MDTSARVLVVDDELGIREGCRRALTPHGFEVEVAENGPTGLRRLREGRFDVLLLDAMMPGMSGVEMLRQVQQLAPDLICIIITGYATVELAVQATREGAHDFIAKPFTSELLPQVINRQLERRQLRREAERVQALQEEARELARAKAELEKLEAVEGRFMLTMVHILRAPVAMLKNSIQLIRKGYVPPEEQPALLERAEQRAGELLTTLDDLLLLAYLKESVGLTKAETVSMADVLEGVLATLKGQADQQGVAVTADVADRPHVTANPDHIKALWTHLLSNAIRHTPAGGQVTVSLRMNREQGQVIGAVSDTGIGIAVEDIPRIFEEFYRTEEAKAMQETGTGLGLPIVQQVVEMYGGTIEVESVVGQGSTFRFTLPLAKRGGP
ncbi:MAG: hybrid sensor histidine kinase/response regulator [Anaerolineae bacterium]|nr:hybrid sensor histidine kinase/response regulator [Anaerolineae bacterium]